VNKVCFCCLADGHECARPRGDVATGVFSKDPTSLTITEGSYEVVALGCLLFVEFSGTGIVGHFWVLKSILMGS
jgi:hypothetical protein